MSTFSQAVINKCYSSCQIIKKTSTNVAKYHEKKFVMLFFEIKLITNNISGF
jgi:hypothetical protein